MAGSVPFAQPLAELFRWHRDAFEAVARHVAGLDPELVYLPGLKGLVVDPAPTEGRPCVLKPAARAVVSDWFRDGLLAIRRKGDAVSVVFRPTPALRALSHPVDHRTTEQKRRDRERDWR